MTIVIGATGRASHNPAIKQIRVSVQITQNATRCMAECFASSDRDAVRYCVVVLKASFDVLPDGRCTWAEQTDPWVHADAHHGDPASTGLRLENDFAPVKPRIDVLLDAFAIPPGGKSVTSMLVGLEGAGIRKAALVTGDRTWQAGLLGRRPSSPVPFSAMPLVWHRAFGGSDLSHADVARHQTEVRNPVGVGLHDNDHAPAIVGKPLPNIESPDAPVRSWSDRPAPVGFGPLGRGWSPRIGHAGTYDQRWMDTTMPFLPADFDERYFQGAPLDQQIDQLPPGSVLTCHGMHPGGALPMKIPGLAVTVKYVFDDHVDICIARTDTVILTPHARRVTLLARTRARLPRKMTALREILVGPSMQAPDRTKPRYASLDDAVKALRPRAARLP
jgi:hypothetical protein